MGHYTNLMEENEGPDPEIPSSPPQPFTNPEPSKPPMVYFSNSCYKLGRREQNIYLHHSGNIGDNQSVKEKIFLSATDQNFSRSANSRVPFR